VNARDDYPFPYEVREPMPNDRIAIDRWVSMCDEIDRLRTVVQAAKVWRESMRQDDQVCVWDEPLIAVVDALNTP
jgi:hypothetical protein